MVRGSERKRRGAKNNDAFIEDLDLEAKEVKFDAQDEDVLVHNKRRKGRVDPTAVLPSDAHKLDDVDDNEALEEEVALTALASKKEKKRLRDADFEIAGITDSLSTSRKTAANPTEVEDTVIGVERDFAALTSSERLKLIEKESPELVKLVQEFSSTITEVKKLAAPLRAVLKSLKPTTEEKQVLDFLEAKLQLMLSYCMHITFYLILKTEGKNIEGHPVIDRLVEIRVYLEKMAPMEAKLHHAINKLLAATPAASATAAKPKVSQLRPLREEGAETLTVNKSRVANPFKEARAAQAAARRAAEIEKEEESQMVRLRLKKDPAATSSALMQPLEEAYVEDEDQFFSKMAKEFREADDDDTNGQSLIARLRANKSMKDAMELSKPGKASKKPAKVEEVPEEFDDEEDFGDDGEDEGGDEEDYEALVEETKNSKPQRTTVGTEGEDGYVPPEVDRREATQRIKNHRGLTKARRKDRKNPRTNRRAKFAKGAAAAKAQSREKKPEPAGPFVGVSSLKPHLTHGVRM